MILTRLVLLSSIASVGVASESKTAGKAGGDGAALMDGSEIDVILPPLSEMDTDNDGKVSRDEFKAWLIQKTDADFNVVDKDNDGFLTKTEYEHFSLLTHVPKKFQGKVQSVAEDTNKFWSAFVNSVAMILATEVGDKTFFIAAILSMRHPQGIVFAGAIGALIVMTVLSVSIGFTLPSLLPREYTHYAATLLFFYFGLKLLYEAYELYKAGEGLGPSDELDEVEIELAGRGLVEGKHDEDFTLDAESGEVTIKAQEEAATKVNDKILHIVTQAFMLTFLAEWGDRSQIATIAMAADKDPIGVVFGGCLGHSFCTGVACIGGRYLAARINERTVIFFGGLTFIVFGFGNLIFHLD